MRYYFILLATGLCALQIAHAAEWNVNGNIYQNFSYEDNPAMRDNKKGSFVYEVIPVLNARYKTQNSEIAASASYGYQDYAAISEFSGDLQDYSLLGQYHAERASYSLTADYSKAPARNSAEFDTGVFDTGADRTSWLVKPEFSYQITAIDILTVNGSYGEILYSTDGFANSKNAVFDLGWARQWTERYTAGLNVVYYRYEAEPTLFNGSDPTLQAANDIVSNSYGFNFSNNYLLSETWQVNIVLGYRYTDTLNSLNIDGATSDIKDGSHGFLTDSSLIYSGEVYSASIGVNQSLVPDGQGQLNQQTGVRLAGNYSLTEKLSTDLQFSYLYSKPISGLRDVLDDTRQYISVTPSIRYQITPDWELSGSYRYRQQDNNLSEQVVSSNTIMLTIGYNWQGLSISR